MFVTSRECSECCRERVEVRQEGQRGKFSTWFWPQQDLPGVPRLCSVREEVADFSAFAGRLLLPWTPLSAVSCRLQTSSLCCSPSEPVFSSSSPRPHICSAIFPPLRRACVLLSFTLPGYADPLLITVSMTAAAGRLRRSRHC